MYPEFLDKEKGKAHWSHADVFDRIQPNQVRSFIKSHYNIGMHTQAFFEINMVIRGGGMHYIENQRIPVEKGDIFIIPPHLRHGYCAESELDVYHILISERFFEQYAAELKSLPFFFTLFTIEPVMRSNGNLQLHLKIADAEFACIDYLLERLLTWSAAFDATSAVMCGSCTLMVIAQLCAMYAEHYPQQLSVREIRCDADFMKSISSIYENHNKKLTIAQLASIANLSRTAYIEAFKKIMHTTPANFILQYRLKKAKELLAQSKLSVLDIALETGFYDSSHFERSFTKAEGCSPVSYRKSMMR